MAAAHLPAMTRACRHRRKRGSRALFVAGLLLSLLAHFPAPAEAQELLPPRLQIGINLIDELLARELPRNSTVFIAEPVEDRLPALIEFAARQRALLFSPFQGDVELGVNAGFKVTDKVLPMVNMASLKQSKIQLKAFFLRIAVKHE